MLALDDSIKVGEKNFLKVRNFAKNLLASFNLGKDDVRVAAMSYSNSASMAFDFADTAGKSLSEIQDNVQAIAYTGGSTSRLDRALGLATSQLLLQSRSGPGIKKVQSVFLVFCYCILTRFFGHLPVSALFDGFLKWQLLLLL